MVERGTAEIQENYRYFQSVVASLMRDHEGEFALLHSCAVVGVFSRAVDAMTEGYTRFGPQAFSVQRVTDRPIDLGFLTSASSDRITA